MKQHWLDIQSFLTDQRVLAAIDDLAIATKFELAGIDDPERKELAQRAREELSRFLRRLGEAAAAADDGKIMGIDPRFKELLDAYRFARRDRGSFHSSLMRVGADAAISLLGARDKRTQRDLLESLDELRRIVEGHQRADVSAILEEI
ncbi:MAG: hypothetical protein IT449_07245 [Phycisphaerales bacterium]|nr:hypothetical protein [Phycisphaerales bacterium]